MTERVFWGIEKRGEMMIDALKEIFFHVPSSSFIPCSHPPVISRHFYCAAPAAAAAAAESRRKKTRTITYFVK